VVVVIYDVLGMGMLAAAWAGDASRPGAPLPSGWVYGPAIAVMLAAMGLLVLASERVVRGCYHDGQGVHLGLLLGACGSALVGSAIVGVGLLDDRLRSARIGSSVAGCVCAGGWPAVVALWNLLVLVRHGHRFRREDVP